MTGQKSYPRAERVRAAIREILASELDHLRDPGLGFVTITDVALTPDLRNARVFYTVYGEDVAKAATKDALVRATKHLRTAVAKQVRMRYVPSLEFIEDPVPERVSRIDALLAQMHQEEDESS
ncbi:MAG TPA: 30S ribosome-binding factor RbfA [Actinomycetota bacterium]|nr:30S ribosome-binding factor RbfA [Actinomycetota bacterium]